MHNRCKGNKFISFVDKKAWKSFVFDVYNLVDIHASQWGTLGSVDNVHFINRVINRLLGIIFDASFGGGKSEARQYKGGGILAERCVLFFLPKIIISTAE